MAEGQSSSANSLPTSIMVSLPTAPPPPPVAQTPARPNNSLSNRKPGILPANLEEMKVFNNPLLSTKHLLYMNFSFIFSCPRPLA